MQNDIFNACDDWQFIWTKRITEGVNFLFELSKFENYFLGGKKIKRRIRTDFEI